MRNFIHGINVLSKPSLSRPGSQAFKSGDPSFRAHLYKDYEIDRRYYP